MVVYYKAVRYDYGSFHDPEFKYGPVGTVVKHPNYRRGDDASCYLSVSAAPADCTGFSWRVDGQDSRLLVVEPIGEVYAPLIMFPNKRAVGSLRVVGELPISDAFGPNGVAVVRYLLGLGLGGLRPDASASVAAWDAARATASIAARGAAGGAAWAAAWGAAGDAAGVAALALVVRDKITPEQFDVLTAPMRNVGVVFDGPEEKG